ncbi:hypothetical protein WA158_001472 [Blastocystis sp. Blastoise]
MSTVSEINQSQSTYTFQDSDIPDLFDVPDYLKHPKEVLYECSMCMEEKPMSDIYIFDCPRHHRFCFDCCIDSIHSFVEQKQKACCPSCTEPHYNLSSLEVAQIFSHGDLSSKEARKAFEFYDNVLFNYYMEEHTMSCLNENCNGKCILYKEDMDNCVEVICPKCHSSQCSICRKPYHHRCSCSQYENYEITYMKWKQGAKYDRAQKRKQYENEMADYENSRQEYEEEKIRIENNFKAMEEDESFLARDARYCPKCHRVIRREGGCTLMICGRDYHGGNIQFGCGEHFNWINAEKYVPMVKQLQTITFDRVIPSFEKNIIHSQNFPCDICKTCPIKGIRFVCLNCPLFNICESCEFDRIKEHFNGKHVFRIVVNPNDI